MDYIKEIENFREIYKVFKILEELEWCKFKKNKMEEIIEKSLKLLEEKGL
jgi:hypothetical protein